VINLHSWEALIFAQVSFLYGAEVEVRRFPEDDGADLAAAASFLDGGGAFNTGEDPALAARIIEERYRNEEAMLQAVSDGDAEKALRCVARYTYRPEERARDPLRNIKNYAIVLNTLLRKAAERGFVHPAHLDAASADFARRIENAAGSPELGRLVELMIRRYSGLVQTHSLRGFSPLIRNVINAVDLNLPEPLSRASLAERFKVDPLRLSSQFKREKGMSLSAYIITARLERAASLLRGTTLYVQEIAERCGYLDVSYFDRHFKRRYGASPRKYRAARR